MVAFSSLHFSFTSFSSILLSRNSGSSLSWTSYMLYSFLGGSRQFANVQLTKRSFPKWLIHWKQFPKKDGFLQIAFLVNWSLFLHGWVTLSTHRDWTVYLCLSHPYHLNIQLVCSLDLLNLYVKSSIHSSLSSKLSHQCFRSQ